MRHVTYRVLHDGAERDVRVDLADDTTVGEVARAIAEHLGDTTAPNPTSQGPGCVRTLTAVPGTSASGEGSTAVDPDRLAVDAAPRCAATVRVVAASEHPVEPPWWSPVVLSRLLAAVDPDPGDPGAGDARLAYGTTTLGPMRLRVGSALSAHAIGSTDRVEVDGTPLRGGVRLGHGSIVRIGDSTFTVRIEGPLRPPDAEGPWRDHGRTPAVVDPDQPRSVELPTPPSADRLPGFPVLSAAVPLLMGAAMWVATRSLAVTGFVLFSVAFVVASGIEVRREHRRERRFREESFRSDLNRAVEHARTRRAAQLERAERHLPSGTEVARWVHADHRRVWERHPDQPDALRVRIGTGDGPAVDPVVVAAGGRADLRVELDAVVEELSVQELPIGVDLGSSDLALCGPGDEPAALARAVLLQLAATLGPEHLEVVLDAAPERAPAWEWLRWLPHRVSHGDPATDRSAQGEAGPSGRRVVTLVDRSGWGPGPVPGPHTRRAGTIWVASSVTEVPDGVATVVTTTPTAAVVRRHDGAPATLRPDGVALEECEPAARALAPLRAPSGDDSVPATVSLRSVLATPALLDDDAAVLDRWVQSRTRPGSLRAPIGATGGGVVDIDLCSDGPHGLVAGTTGSGKSELLRTLVVSLALHHPPDRLTFLLVDYKGGAAFRGISELPHVVGLVTDLGPAEARRALVSLRAEVRRRERVVASAGVTDMVDVPAADASPALLVVVDEFATLAAELPDLLDGLLDVAQRGRSLGVHLLLATQRPGGVVTDAIRANLSLRLALRVADEEDSRDVIDGVDAAHLPAGHPGRAVLRLGPGRRSTLQVASTTGAAALDQRVVVQDLQPGPTTAVEWARPGTGPTDPASSSPTELDAAVDRCRSVAASEPGRVAPRRPWLEPLPEHLERSALERPSRPGAVVIGLADLPAEQRRTTVEVDLERRGGVLVMGAPRSGRSGTLRTIAAASVSDPRTLTTVHAIDNGRSLDGIEQTAGAGGTVDVPVGADDAEATLRLLRSLRRRCRTGGTGAEDPGSRGRVVLLVDGIGAFVERHERVNRGEAVDLLTALAGEGPASGVHLAVTAGRAAEVPPAILTVLDQRLLLRCATPDDAAVLDVVDPHGPARNPASPDPPAGRGLFDGRLVQVAAPPTPLAGPDDDPGHQRSVTSRHARRLAASVDAETLPPASGWTVPVGIRHDDLGVAVLDLSRSGALVLGPPRSGRSTALAMIVRRLDPTGCSSVLTVDGHRPDGAVDALSDLLERVVAEGTGTESTGTGGTAATVPTIVAVDDLPELLDGPDGVAIDAVLDRLLRMGPDVPLRVVATAEADAASRCYADSFRRLRSTRTGLLLRPDPDLHPPLLHTSLPLHDELVPTAGRGWLVDPDGVVAVQLAR
ncbi:MAG TPA: FtsK/SpoIIIE domain-containing protein [Microthrixaceae bacterium]|nr:FtsK/SpoIIIE domain-containing protein [Microthrixaceae bacterium]